MTLVDFDKIEASNLNRQLIATHGTIGRRKVDVMKERILSINPSARVDVFAEFLLPENMDDFPLRKDWEERKEKYFSGDRGRH